MTLIYFATAVGVSLAGLAYLIATDPKRRRVFDIQSPQNLPRSALAGWLVVIAPATVLVALGQIGAMLAWFGAVTVGAWLLAGRRPG